jgi:hypothetical protein
MPTKAILPRNQKAVYHSFARVFEAIMNEEITPEKATAACKALSGMNTAFGNEVRLMIASGKVEQRASIESTVFEDTAVSLH